MKLVSWPDKFNVFVDRPYGMMTNVTQVSTARTIAVEHANESALAVVVMSADKVIRNYNGSYCGN
ncbi:hypothetical protein OH492_28510 [Vibrio chagasii]|nr:hypothetical protein [Vibrio chagasii]